MSWGTKICDEAGWRGWARNTYRTPWGNVNFNVFFDRNVVASRLDRFELRVLSRTGAAGRSIIRRSIRKAPKKKKLQRGGRPPRYHVRGAASLKDGIFFQAELDEGGVLIGPRRLSTAVKPMALQSGAQLLEEGGNAIGYLYEPRNHTYEKKQMRFRPHPFVGPARAPIQRQFLSIIDKVKL